MMDQLPPELLQAVLSYNISMCRFEKNELIKLRLVCKAFDAALRPYAFKTLQLEMEKFRHAKGTANLEALKDIGVYCKAIYCDLMVIRDEEEIVNLMSAFHSILGRVPEFTAMIESQRKYCMNETTFDEADFRRVFNDVLRSTPNLTSVKLNLPFQIIGRSTRTATILLASAFECLARRPWEHKPLETFVLDHVSDASVLSICSNPIDLKNALQVFRDLKHLVISFKRQEKEPERIITFTIRLWHLITAAEDLETMCLIGWNVKRSHITRIHNGSETGFPEWMMKSFPYPPVNTHRALKNLRCLELKRIDIDSELLIKLIEDNSECLRELYLNEVYLKVFGTSDEDQTASWIVSKQDPDSLSSHKSVADQLKDMPGLHLEIIRATGLGYDDYEPNHDPEEPKKFDLEDPAGLGRSFDLRFVEAVMGVPQPPDANLTPSSEEDSDSTETATIIDENNTPAEKGKVEEKAFEAPPPHTYDVEAHQQICNTTSHYKRSIDGLFFNHNDTALQQLQQIISVADRGMAFVNEQFRRIVSAVSIEDLNAAHNGVVSGEGSGETGNGNGNEEGTGLASQGEGSGETENGSEEGTGLVAQGEGDEGEGV